jgi:hypothetical protein
MTLPEIYERVAALPSGGYLTIDSRLDKGYIYSLIHSARAVIVNERWRNDTSIPPVYKQEYVPEFIKAAQDSTMCCSIFYGCPELVALDNRASGLGFVGTSQGIPKTFAEVTDEVTLSGLINTRRSLPIKKFPLVLRTREMVRIYYKDVIKDFKMVGVFFDPTLLPDYDIPTSDYPIDIGDIAKVELYLMQGAMNAALKTIVDRIANSRDESAA